MPLLGAHIRRRWQTDPPVCSLSLSLTHSLPTLISSLPTPPTFFHPWQIVQIAQLKIPEMAIWRWYAVAGCKFNSCTNHKEFPMVDFKHPVYSIRHTLLHYQNYT